MSTFPLAWLSLREPFDHQARSEALTARFAEALPASPRLLDLGCGHGSSLRYLSPRLPRPQRWTLLDHDPALLGWLAEQPAPDGAEVTLQQQDISAGLEAVDLSAIDGVVTSALLDLVSRPWLAELARRCADAALPLLAVLTVDGRVSMTPEDPDDADVLRWFRAHQRTDRGFGPSPGHTAADVAAGLLEAAGMTVRVARADWHIPPEAGAMLAEMIAGIAHAAEECAPRPEAVRRWRGRRLAAARAGQVQMQVGHLDLLALP